MLQFQSGSEDLSIRGVDGVSASLRTGEGPARTGRQREHIHFFLHFFCSIQALTGWDDAHQAQRKQDALLRVQIQMLISPRSPLTDTRRNSV